MEENMENKNPTIGVPELALMKTIIETASERGTFKAEELASVGQVYNRLSAFLEQVLSEAGAQQASTESADEDVSAETEQGESND